jgi:hypothetical protein
MNRRLFGFAMILGFFTFVELAHSVEHIACNVKCSKKGPDGQTVYKEHQCVFPVPPGVSFGAADCQSQCQTQCANIIYGKNQGKANPTNRSAD